MLFRDIIGQKSIIKELIRGVKEGRIAHSQLFAGEDGYGSFAIALAYAQYINCSNRGEDDSCGECPSCYKYKALQHPDLHFIFPFNKTSYSEGTNSEGDVVSDNLLTKWREIINSSNPQGYFTIKEWTDSIEISKNSQPIISRAEANHLLKKLSFHSFEGGYSVVIIYLPEFMNEAAANALLKLFEEPAEKSIFLFVSCDTSKILKTILSRVQLINIKQIDSVSFMDYIANTYGNQVDKTILYRLSGGNICRARQIINTFTNSSENIYFDHFVALMRLCFTQSYIGLVGWAENLSLLKREDQRNFIIYSIKLLRDAYSINIGMGELSLAINKEVEFLKKFSPYVHHQNIEKLIEEFERCNYHLSQNVNNKTLFTHFTLAISKLISLPK